MRLRIRRISPSSLMALFAAAFFLLGLALGLVGAFAAFSGKTFTLSGPVSFTGTGKEMFLFSLAYPFFCALAGAIAGFLIAGIYNVCARFTGGVGVECAEENPLPK